MAPILWFGRELRLADDHGLAAAVSRGQAIAALSILNDED
jgi:deoxyribodipyrimidine photolyase